MINLAYSNLSKKANNLFVNCKAKQVFSVKFSAKKSNSRVKLFEDHTLINEAWNVRECNVEVLQAFGHRPIRVDMNFAKGHPYLVDHIAIVMPHAPTVEIDEVNGAIFIHLALKLSEKIINFLILFIQISFE